jgi:hypothetical protein
MEVVAELATYQLAGPVLDAGQQGLPVERARLLENTFIGIVPPWRLFGTPALGGHPHQRSAGHIDESAGSVPPGVGRYAGQVVNPGAPARTSGLATAQKL